MDLKAAEWAGGRQGPAARVRDEEGSPQSVENSQRIVTSDARTIQPNIDRVSPNGYRVDEGEPRPVRILHTPSQPRIGNIRRQIGVHRFDSESSVRPRQRDSDFSEGPRRLTPVDRV